MKTELLLQAAREIKEICDNADGCDGCPFAYMVSRLCVMCKLSDKGGYKSEPSKWNLDGNRRDDDDRQNKSDS